jgi:histidine triad (HIT) family protein
VQDKNCIFCRIVDGKIPARVVMQNDAMAVFNITWKIAGAVEAGSHANASTIAIHNGCEAGQEIPHMHVHIVPRGMNDGAGPIHSMFKNRPSPSPKEMDSLRDRIVSKL